MLIGGLSEVVCTVELRPVKSSFLSKQARNSMLARCSKPQTKLVHFLLGKLVAILHTASSNHLALLEFEEKLTSRLPNVVESPTFIPTRHGLKGDTDRKG